MLGNVYVLYYAFVLWYVSLKFMLTLINEAFETSNNIVYLLVNLVPV
jgi:hypothetical protein